MTEFLRELSLQQQQQNYGDSDGDNIPDNEDKWLGKNDRTARKEAIKNIAGVIVGEYYQGKAEFSKNHPLVKEIQDELLRLGYDLGTTGKSKNGVDGDLGAKTITAIHDFEQDHSAAMKFARDVFPELNELKNLELLDIKVLNKVLSVYASGGLSDNERKELCEINQLFKSYNSAQIIIESFFASGESLGEMNIITSNRKRVKSLDFLNVSEDNQYFAQKKERIIEEALKQYSSDGTLTDKEIEIIGRLSSVMNVQNPIPSIVRSSRGL